MQQHASSSYGQSSWTVSACGTDEGALSIVSRTRSRSTQQWPPLGQPSLQDQTQTEEEEVTTSVSLILKGSQAGHALKLRIRQTYGDDGIFSSIPHLTFHNILPLNAPVFRTILEGRFRDFLVLLQEGKASLHDQNEDGASLLFVSVLLSDKCSVVPKSLCILVREHATRYMPIPHPVWCRRRSCCSRRQGGGSQ